MSFYGDLQLRDLDSTENLADKVRMYTNASIYVPMYSKTPIYRGVWGQGIIRGKSGSAVNRGFVRFTLCMFSPIWGKGNGRGISGFAVNRGAVNQGFTI